MRLVALHRSAAIPAGGLAATDVLLAGGRGAPSASGAGRVLDRGELCRNDEWNALSDAVVSTVRRWIDEERHRGDGGFPAIEAAGGALLVRCLQAAKAGLLIARALENAPGIRRIAVSDGWTGARDALASMGVDPPVDWIRCRRPARLAGLTCRLRWGRGRPSAPRERRRESSAEDAVAGLETPRLRPLLDELEDAGVPLRRVEQRAENRFLPPGPGDSTGSCDPPGRSWESLVARLPEPPAPPPARDFDLRRLLQGVLRAAGPPEVVRQARDFAGWRAWLRARRPRLLLGPPPWAGDLRALALAARAEGARYVCVQDGAMSPLGQGGLLPEDRALCWGEAGREWFLGQRYAAEDLLVAADPGLERLREAASRLDPALERRRLGLPSGGRLVLTGLSNSAPHTLAYEEDDPLIRLDRIAASLSGTRDWKLVLKPHPRLPRVDGWSRIAEGRALVAAAGGHMVGPWEPLPALLACCEAYVGEGDTLTLEALACGLGTLVWRDPATDPPYPDFLGGSLAVARPGDELPPLLAGASDRRGEELLSRHFAGAPRPAEALSRWIDG